MRRFFFLFLLTFYHFVTFGQSEFKEDTLTTSRRCKPWSGAILDVGFIQYTQNSGYIQPFPDLNDWRSKGVNLYYYFGIPIGCKFNIAPGLGLGLDGFHFTPTSTRLGSSGDSLIISNTGPGIKSEKSKLAVNYFDIPLEIRFQTGKTPQKAFRIAIGGKVGFLYNSHTKVKYTKPSGNEVKEKLEDDFGLNGIRYGLIGRIGYSYLNLYGYYSLSKLFNEHHGPEVTPFMIGISFSPSFYFNFD